MGYEPRIFPGLKGKVWVEIDLGARAKAEFGSATGPNPLLNAAVCDAWVKKAAEDVGADFTWGGHFEDRKALWRGYYEGQESLVHLGVDYDVPAGTEVAAPRACSVVHSWADPSGANGWGGRLILKLDEEWLKAKYLILGHLEYAGLAKDGTRFAAGEVLGRVGVSAENGGWFPHVHVQCCSEEFFDSHGSDLRLLDGYAELGLALSGIAPDPSRLVGAEHRE